MLASVTGLKSQFLNAAGLPADPIAIGLALAVGVIFGNQRVFACVRRDPVGLGR